MIKYFSVLKIFRMFVCGFQHIIDKKFISHYPTIPKTDGVHSHSVLCGCFRLMVSKHINTTTVHKN